MPGLRLYPANYAHPEWPDLANDLATDVHRNEGLARTNPATNLQKQEVGTTSSRYFLLPSKLEEQSILAIASYGIRPLKESTLIVRELFVPRNLRRMGYGRITLSLIEEEAKRMSLQRIKLDALRDSVPFYRILGYEAPKRDYPSIIMTKNLA